MLETNLSTLPGKRVAAFGNLEEDSLITKRSVPFFKVGLHGLLFPMNQVISEGIARGRNFSMNIATQNVSVKKGGAGFHEK